MNHENHIELSGNPFSVEPGKIPVMDYNDFYNMVSDSLISAEKHCTAYFGIEMPEGLRFICCIADDDKGTVSISAFDLPGRGSAVRSLTPVCPQLHIFEREIHELYGVEFEGHPWLKPVRYSHNRHNGKETINNYPFYSIESEELHEVGVGPIHAGVIEPGHFRFICNGEKVLHLEIQLGYQHRGIERLFLDRSDSLQRCIISESIAGDTAVGHSLAHAQLIESLSDIAVSDALKAERCIALEMERIAVHTGDTAALCGDVAYQLGQVVCESIRTLVINATQTWCGNRFGKGLIRPGGTNYPLNEDFTEKLLVILNDVEKRYTEVTECIFSIPSVLARFEDIGQITYDQALRTGTVGMAARSSGLFRDIRNSHPFQYYSKLRPGQVTIESGDVLARGLLRVREVKESINIIRKLVNIWKEIKKDAGKPIYDYKLAPDRLGLSIVEGWRGEICHSAITDKNGDIKYCKFKDPSFHNWMALALAVRNQEISDFPVCNKSFNLSYCGNDL